MKKLFALLVCLWAVCGQSATTNLSTVPAVAALADTDKLVVIIPGVGTRSVSFEWLRTNLVSSATNLAGGSSDNSIAALYALISGELNALLRKTNGIAFGNFSVRDLATGQAQLNISSSGTGAFDARVVFSNGVFHSYTILATSNTIGFLNPANSHLPLTLRHDDGIVMPWLLGSGEYVAVSSNGLIFKTNAPSGGGSGGTNFPGIIVTNALELLGLTGEKILLHNTNHSVGALTLGSGLSLAGGTLSVTVVGTNVVSTNFPGIKVTNSVTAGSVVSGSVSVSGGLALDYLSGSQILIHGGDHDVVGLSLGSGLSLVGTTLSSSSPVLVTNSVWVSAGSMIPAGGTTAEGGRNGAASGSWTNLSSVTDVLDFDSATNEAAVFNFQPSRGFIGALSFDLYWASANTLNGASNVVWQVAAQVLNTNGAPGAFTYFTNVTARFFSSNTVQSIKLPVLNMTIYDSAPLLDLRITRLGTNTADEASGDARLIGARITFAEANYLGGF